MTVEIHETPHLASVATAADLEDWGPLEEAADPEIPMTTAGITLWSDGDQEVGVWQCTAGPSRWTLQTHEQIYVLAGRMTVTPDGGESTELAAGDTAVFPKGWTGTWQIHETLRKLYVIFRPSPAAALGFDKLNRRAAARRGSGLH